MTHGNTRHGHSRRGAASPTYAAWASMFRRCYLPSQESYHLYGGRGIAVCDRWRTFENFMADMGEKPAGTSLDRIDSDGSYTPENCRWATPSQQAVNRRGTRLIEHNGQRKAAAEWAQLTGIPSSAIRTRIDRLGWDVARALSEPLVPADVSVRKAASMQAAAPVAAYLEALGAGESCAAVAARHGVTPSAVSKALSRIGRSVGEFTQTTEARRARALSRKAPHKKAI